MTEWIEAGSTRTSCKSNPSGPAAVCSLVFRMAFFQACSERRNVGMGLVSFNQFKVDVGRGGSCESVGVQMCSQCSAKALASCVP